MKAYDIRDDVEFILMQPEDFGVGNDIFAVLVVISGIDESTDIMQQRRDLEQQPAVGIETVL